MVKDSNPTILDASIKMAFKLFETNSRTTLTTEALRILNEPLSFAESMKLVLEAVKRKTGLDAVGIRIRSGADFPYFIQDGFTDDFLLTENTIITRDEKDSICRNEDGSIKLDCTCGMVIQGRTAVSEPFLTPGGSFWTNESTELLKIPIDQDPRTRPRNRCIHDGYQSVALIPIQVNKENFGLLQLNDRRMNCFTLDLIQFFEGFCASIGIALMRRQAEEALRESETRYRNLFGNNHAIMLVIDPADGAIRDANPAASIFYGWNHEELLGKKINDINMLTPEEVHAEMQLALTEKRDHFIFKHRRADDVIRDVEVFSGPLNLEGKTLLYSIIHDITERKQAEKELLDEKGRLGTILNTVGDPIFVQDNDHRITLANRAFYDLFGVDESAVIGYTLAEHVPEDERTHFLSVDRRVLDTGIPDVREETLTAEGRASRTIVTRKARYIDNSGNRFLVGSIHDITERKNAEEESRKLNSQLQESQKMEAIGNLASGIAHDFNNILTGILGHASLLKIRTKDVPANYQSALTIEAAAERGAELTGQLLGFARKGKYQIQRVNINKIIDDVVQLLERSIDKRISVVQLPSHDEPNVRGDPGQMQQVMMNLALNARDAMPDGGKLVFQTEVVYTEEKFDLHNSGGFNSRYLKVSVSDTGHGIPEDHLERIFEPFFTTKEQGKGTGMGLAMVYGIVHNHGGIIHVSSEVDSGTTFRIYLPLEETIETEEPAPSVESVQSGSGRILLIDDESVIRDVVSEMLNVLGYASITAQDGEEGVNIYREESANIDLVIIDMMMPKLNGRDCFLELKKINPNIKAILSTGFSLEGRAQEILDEGVIGFIKKPYTVEKLSKSVVEALA